MSGTFLTIISTLVVLGVLIFVHELGHFVAAKASGIYVHRFSLGLGAPIPWLTFRRGETEYSVSWLPLGGYVKMASELEEASARLEGGAAPTVDIPKDRFFESKPVWVRMIVILAGVFMNFLFALVVFTGIYLVSGARVTPTTTIAAIDETELPRGGEDLARLRVGSRVVSVDGEPVSSWEGLLRRVLSAKGDSVLLGFDSGGPTWVKLPKDEEGRAKIATAIRFQILPIIDSVVPDRPAAAAGIQKGDTIISIDGIALDDWSEVVRKIESYPKQSVEMVLGRRAGRATVRVTPAEDTVIDSATGAKRKVGRIGVMPLIPEARERVELGSSISLGAKQTGHVVEQIAGVVKGMVAGQVSTRQLGGPIAIGQQAGRSVRRGPEEFLFFMAVISVNLAVLNLLPIPVLDGGQFLFLLAEGITRRPVAGKVREWLTVSGLVLILGLMVLAFSNDIRRLLGF